MLCYAACPIYELEPEFIGPAAIALAQRYNFDSRDEGVEERMDVISQADGIWACTFVGECSTVCPKNVDPAGAKAQADFALKARYSGIGWQCSHVGSVLEQYRKMEDAGVMEELGKRGVAFQGTVQ